MLQDVIYSMADDEVKIQEIKETDESQETKRRESSRIEKNLKFHEKEMKGLIKQYGLTSA